MMTAYPHIERSLILFNCLSELPSKCFEENRFLRHVADGKFSEIIETFLDDAFSHESNEKIFEKHYLKLLLDVVNLFMRQQSGKYNENEFLCVGVACLYGYVQCNWTGPPSTLPNNAHVVNLLERYCRRNDFETNGDNFKSNIRNALNRNNDEVVSNVCGYDLLLLAETIFKTCHAQSSVWWLLRAKTLHQQSLYSDLSSLYDVISSLISQIESYLQSTGDKLLETIFLLEVIQIYTKVYPNQVSAQKYVERVMNHLKLDASYDGILGKRTRYQQRDLPQLVFKVDSNDTANECGIDDNMLTYVGKFLPREVQLNDEVRLNSIEFTENADKDDEELNILQQAAILALYSVNLKKPKDGLSAEELSAHLTYLLKQPKAWSLQMGTLQFRSYSETNDSRAIERAFSQFQNLLDAIKVIKPDVPHRLLLFHCSHLAPSWTLKTEMAEILLSMGAVQSALDIFLELQNWERLVHCYNSLNLNHKAAKVIRDEMDRGRATVRMWCLLGDVTDDEECYKKAWELSEYKCWRPLKHWGLFHYQNKRFGECIPHFEKSLEINSLQVAIWFKLGYAYLTEEKWEESANAYRRYCSFNPDCFEGWNNLSKAYIQLGQKERASRTLQESIKLNYENWKIWHNLLVVSIDIGDFNEVLRCYHRLLDLKGKYLDVRILEILVDVLVAGNKVTDVTDMTNETLKLFGRITAQITNNAKVWQLYATITELSNTAEKESKTVHYLQRAHNIIKNEPNWRKSMQECKHLVATTLLLSDAYEHYSKQLSTEHSRQQLSTAKMMLHGIIVLIKKEHTSLITGEINSELKEDMKRLEDKEKAIQAQLSNV